MKSSFFKGLCAVLCVCLAASVFCSCAFLPKKPTQTTTNTTVATTELTTQTDIELWRDMSFSNYNHLDSNGQEEYQRILLAIRENLKSMKESVEDFENLTLDTIYFYNVMADNPEYFDVRANSTLYTDTETGEKSATFNLKHIYSSKEMAQKQEKINAIFEQIASSLPADADDFVKARAVYDYLIDNCDYDESYTGNSLEENTTTASYADGALIDRLAVCSGYSRAFKLMMDRFGIECACVCNSNHEWNVIKIEGNYYHIDVTWADTGAVIKGKYFCVSDNTIYKDHEKPAFDLPKCEFDY